MFTVEFVFCFCGKKQRNREQPSHHLCIMTQHLGALGYYFKIQYIQTLASESSRISTQEQ